MGHGSFISHFGGTFWTNLVNFIRLLGNPMNADGDPVTMTGLLAGPYVIGEEQAQAFAHVTLVFVLLLVMSLVVYSKVKNTKEALVPSASFSLVNVFEILVTATFGMMRDIMGDKAARFFLPLIGTCAFFILFSNGFGLVPGFLPPTSSLNVTFACGIIIFFCTHIFGVKENGIGYFKHFFGPIIKWYALPLMLLMLLVELISHIVRPISLAIRLMANMFADHAVLGVFVGLVPFIIPVPILMLGSLVVVVQTLVFCILSTVYISMAIEHSEDH